MAGRRLCGSLRHDSLCCSELLRAASGRSLWAENGEGLLCQLLCVGNGAGLLCRSLRPSSLCCSELFSAVSGVGRLCCSLCREGCYRGEGTC